MLTLLLKISYEKSVVTASFQPFPYTSTESQEGINIFPQNAIKCKSKQPQTSVIDAYQKGKRII